MVRILFVCLGNICRSPTAECVVREHLERVGLGEQCELDSAGTAAYHVGDRPDERSRAFARKRGITVDGRGRQFRREDLDRFDLVLAMDHENLRNIEALASDPAHHDRIRLFLDFAAGHEGTAVPDPYYGGDAGFEEVIDLCLAGAEGLEAWVRERVG